MGTYLQNYGAGEERRNQIIKRSILGTLAFLLVVWGLYAIFHDRSEKKAIDRFLAEVNSRQYQKAYADWGCTSSTPCPNYDYQRFLQDWGPQSKAKSGWSIASTDSCREFLTVNVKAEGTEVQSLGVERGKNAIMYAPAAECQERKWRWKQFFQRVFGGGEPVKS